MAIPISAQGYQRLEKELAQLKEDRPAIIQAIKEAREQGDLRENAGYDAARERQGMNEARINYLENRLAQATIVDLDKLSGSKVVFGCTVTVVDVDTEEEKVFTILGPDEAEAYIRPKGGRGKVLVDLRGAIRQRLMQLGLDEENIDVSDECTMCQHEKYWSHRYSRGQRGSQCAFICL